MADTAPYSGLSHDRLTALINSDNKLSLVEGTDFTYGTPNDYSDAKQRNTVVTLNPVTGGKLSAPADVHYTRLGIDALGRLPASMVGLVTYTAIPFTIHQILDRINEAYNINLLPEEVADTQYTAKQDSYALQVVAGSLAWKPSTYNFRAYMEGDDIPLADVIVTTVLDGFDYPAK